MDANLFNTYLREIAEFVLDEEKIVTYKWLSRTLNIHVNTAKQLLYTFTTNQHKETPTQVTATYLLAGKLKNGTHSLVLVNENELQDVCSIFDEITSEHVYSLQKSKEIKDFQLLYAVDKSIDVTKCFTPIITPQNDSLRKAKENIKDEEKTVEKLSIGSKAQNNAISKTVVEGLTEENKNEKQKKKGESPKKKNANALAALFATQASKQKVNAEKKTVTGGSTQKTSNIANFFTNCQSNQNRVTSPKNKTSEEKIILINEPEKSEKLELYAKNCIKALPKVEKSRGRVKRDTKKEKNKDNTESKKRKRIKVFSDSDDSGSDATCERSPSPYEEPEALPEPEAEPEPSAKIIANEEDNAPCNKRKKRKIIDKLVMNDDGYMETKKEVIYDTDSDVEMENGNPNPTVVNATEVKKSEPKLKQAPKTAVVKSSLNESKKQSSLLSFFKKN